MWNRLTSVSRVVAVALGLLAATTAQAQGVRPAAPNNPTVHQMTIYNGGTKTVQYFTNSQSLSEQSALRDLERAENEAQYASDLLALKRQYLGTELALEPVRRARQAALYGIVRERDYGSSVSGNNFLVGSIAGGGAAGIGMGVGYPFGYVFAGNTAFGPSYTVLDTVRTVENLGIGIGPEGRIKDDLAAMIARQATPEYAVTAARAYRDALSSAVGVFSRPGGNEGIVAAGGLGSVNRPQVSLTLKGGEKIEGRLVQEDADWIVVDTDKEEVRVRPADVVRMSTLRKK
jgi:hypothetical protein